MQYIKIAKNASLSELTEQVGPSHIDEVLHINNVPRIPKVGRAFDAMCRNIIETGKTVDWQRKSSLLNSLTSDSDVFETAALLGSSGWKLFSAIGTFPGMLKIPEFVNLASATQVLGNRTPVADAIYKGVMAALEAIPHTIDPSIFNDYSAIRVSQMVSSTFTTNQVFQWFRIPWGEVTLYSSLYDVGYDFPVIPEEMSDGVSASYTTMPDLLYQYEPWQLYTGSGPRSNTYTFDFHRDMWTGDHNDGKANELIRFCMANCYPKYRGAEVNAPIVSLYMHGDLLIRGILTNVSVDWDGPLGSDDMWYLHCKLALSITEIASQPLNFDAVRLKPLIG